MDQLELKHALAAVAAAPLLADLPTYTCWDTLYKPVFGTLSGFVGANEDTVNCQLLQVPGGLLLKLPRATTSLKELSAHLQESVNQVCGSIKLTDLLHGKYFLCITSSGYQTEVRIRHEIKVS